MDREDNNSAQNVNQTRQTTSIGDFLVPFVRRKLPKCRHLLGLPSEGIGKIPPFIGVVKIAVTC